MDLILTILIAAFGLLAGAEYLFHRGFIRRKKTEAAERARQVVEDAERQVEIRLKELEFEAREKADAAEAAFEQDFRKKRADLQTARRQIEDQERLLDRKVALLAQSRAKWRGRRPPFKSGTRRSPCGSRSFRPWSTSSGPAWSAWRE